MSIYMEKENNIEYKIVAAIYWLCLIFTAIIYFNDIEIYWNRMTWEMALSILDFHTIVYLVYFPVAGLWCLKHKYDWGYLFLGAILYYVEENFWYTFIQFDG